MTAKRVLVYQLWPIAWGCIRLMTAFLPRIKALGVDYVWVSPVLTSPRHNHGYDVADYYSVDPRLGTLKDFDEFIKSAHVLGLKVVMDLVIDSTSVEHIWFMTDWNRYIWERNPPDWNNLFDQGSAWEFDCARKKYYLHLGHPAQADLNWFYCGRINRTLVDSFKNIMFYWLHEHGLDGFRIDSIQSLNKDVSQDRVKYNDLLIGTRAVEAINELSNLYGGKTPFLMADCYDPSYGDVVKYYAEKTDVEFISNSMLKKAAIGASARTTLAKKIEQHVQNSKYMLELESHDSPRFTSRSEMSGKEVINLMFTSGANAICLYQGQELGLENPTEAELSISDILSLDSRAAVQFEKRAAIEAIRQNSRANTRVPIPLLEYAKQECDENSVLNYTKTAIQKWKMR
ncbi:hypothetical protein IKG24_01100 [Candidatus Saccharibacteria bacterium]|nr:hypothetical protein [Candidatus Saccharibacteria bacterium]